MASWRGRHILPSPRYSGERGEELLPLPYNTRVSQTNPTDRCDGASLDRRRLLRLVGAAGLLAVLPTGCARRTPDPPGEADDALLRFPGKVPMRALNDSPPNLETPWLFYREDITPNDAFFVRWHLQFIPTTVDLRTWRLKVGGHVEQPLELSMDDLRQMKATSLVAVNQCSGNSRGLFEPHVPGGPVGQRGDGQRALDRRAAARPAAPGRRPRRGHRRHLRRPRPRRLSRTRRPNFVKSLPVAGPLIPSSTSWWPTR